MPLRPDLAIQFQRCDLPPDPSADLIDRADFLLLRRFIQHYIYAVICAGFSPIMFHFEADMLAASRWA